MSHPQAVPSLRGVPLRCGVAECWLGFVLVVASEEGAREITLGDSREGLIQQAKCNFPDSIAYEGGDDDVLAAVLRLIERPESPPEVPLDIRGTPFQRSVWKALRAIPPGSTMSYAEVARQIGAPGSHRAVASACSANRLAIAIPCHRVVSSDGSLSGFRWGVERKRALLAREAASRPRLSLNRQQGGKPVPLDAWYLLLKMRRRRRLSSAKP